MGVSAVVRWSLLSVLACRAPELKTPDIAKGGFVLRCVGITDNVVFRGQTPQCVSVANRGGIDPMQDGACACSKPDAPVDTPPLTNDPLDFNLRLNTEVAGAVRFGDSSCTTIVADTCVPYAVETAGAYQDPVPNTPAGYVRIDSFLARRPEFATQPIGEDFVGGSSDSQVTFQASKDTYDAIRANCTIAQFNVMTQKLFGYPPFSFEWAAEIDRVGLLYNSRTSHVNGGQLETNGWGILDKPAGAPSRIYATHKYRPFNTVFTHCNEGLVYPWGKAAVQDFQAPAFTANDPKPLMMAQKRTPKRRERVLLRPGSSGLLTTSSDSSATAIDLLGHIEITGSDCDDAGSTCVATLTSMVVTAPEFTFHGRHVVEFEVRAAPNVTGALQGDLLAFNSFSGTLRFQLSDGKYDTIPVSSGVILSRWDPGQDSFVMAFSFTGELEQGVTATIDGSGMGVFVNTSPTARIGVSPSTESSSGVARVECDGPVTHVSIDASMSHDREDESLDYLWYLSEDVVSQSSVFQTSFALGDHSIGLMTYDSAGFAGEAGVSVRVADTRPPDIVAPDLCVFPPNHQQVCVQLFDELAASAADKCYGDLTTDVRIVNVRSTGDSVTSWSATEICFRVERNGFEPDRLHTVTLAVTDASGNVATHDTIIKIPHDASAKATCHKTQNVGGSP